MLTSTEGTRWLNLRLQFRIQVSCRPTRHHLSRTQPGASSFEARVRTRKKGPPMGKGSYYRQAPTSQPPTTNSQHHYPAAFTTRIPGFLLSEWLESKLSILRLSSMQATCAIAFASCFSISWRAPSRSVPFLHEAELPSRSHLKAIGNRVQWSCQQRNTSSLSPRFEGAFKQPDKHVLECMAETKDKDKLYTVAERAHAVLLRPTNAEAFARICLCAAVKPKE